MLAQVMSEEDTLAAVEAGNSIARFGDGEMHLLRGRKCISQDPHPGLQRELLRIISVPVPRLIVGVPRVTGGPKDYYWTKLAPKFDAVMNPDMRYGSAFITRPDSAPWIKTPAYFERVAGLWRGQSVTFVGNGQRSLTPEFLTRTGAARVHFVKSSYTNSYEHIDQLERDITAAPPMRVILCVGATATCLAARLCRQGYHAIDLGHIGHLWPKEFLRGG